jgi:hypothetical protein
VAPWLVQALCYKQQGHGLESGLGHWIFLNDPIFAPELRSWECTQLPSEMSTRSLPESKARPPRKSDNLADICKSVVYKV